MQKNGDQKDYEDYFRAIEKRVYEGNYASSKRTSSSDHRKKRKVNKKALFSFLAVVLSIVLVIVLICSGIKSCGKTNKIEKTAPKKAEIAQNSSVKVKKEINLFPKYENISNDANDDITSKAFIVIDDDKNEVVAARSPKEKMYPASTTKVMTLLVAVEQIKDYSDTFKMTYQITDPLYKEGATVAGFSSGEVLNMNDLIYGTILPSGGDAAMGLAEKISGSEEKFVSLMNKKAKELKLKNTHFTNCTGLFNQNHYTTAEDLSVILRTAMRNKVCKKVLSTYKYTTSKTKQHPNGIDLENTLFKYMYGTEPQGANILGGKTGFVNESGYCIATFGESDSGKSLVCVSLFGESRWPAVYDQISLYTKYSK